MHFKNNKINETMIILIIKVKLFPISKKLFKLCKTNDCNDEIEGTLSLECIYCILSKKNIIVNLITLNLN